MHKTVHLNILNTDLQGHDIIDIIWEQRSVQFEIKASVLQSGGHQGALEGLKQLEKDQKKYPN